MKRGVELGDRFTLPQAQRVEVGILVATEAEGVDQLQYANLLGIHLGIGNGGAVTGGVLGQAAEIVANLGMGLFYCMSIDLGQRLEQIAPFVGHGLGVFQEGFVQILNVACIRTSQVR